MNEDVRNKYFKTRGIVNLGSQRERETKTKKVLKFDPENLPEENGMSL